MDLSILDFKMAETLKKILIFEQDVGYDVILQLPNIMAYCNRVFSIDKIELFREDCDFIERPFFKKEDARWT